LDKFLEIKMAEIVFTNHVIDRIYERKISQDQVIEGIKNFDEQFKNSDTTQFRKKFGKQTLTAVTKYGDGGEIVVLSVWIDPPNPGTSDLHKREKDKQMRKASALKKLWYTFLNQIGL